MTALQQQLVRDLTSLKEDISHVRSNLRPTFQNAINALPEWTPQWAVDFAVARSNEAITALDGEADKAMQFCQDACNNIVACENVREAAQAYAAIDFLPSMLATNPSDITGTMPDSWISENTDQYEGRLDELAKRLARMRTSVGSLTRSLEQLADAMEDRDTDLAIAVAAIILCLVSLIMALGTAVTGVGFIIGLAVAVISFAVSLIALHRVATVVPGRLEECRDEVRSNSFMVRSDPWPTPPRLTAADW